MKNKNFDIISNNSDEWSWTNQLSRIFEPTFKEMTNFDRAMKTDVKEKDNCYELEIDMPGFEKSDINLSLNDGYLSICAKKESNEIEKNKNGNFVRRERKFGSSSRSFYVGDIDEKDIDASLDKGVLTIIVPKENTKKIENKRIEIK